MSLFHSNLERYTEIERENRILLEKMTSILQTKGPCSAPHNQSVSVENRTISEIQSSITSSLPPIHKRSLNNGLRKREMLKITQENQLLLKRLQERKPVYDVKQWAKEDQIRQRKVQDMCEYPYQLRE